MVNNILEILQEYNDKHMYADNNFVFKVTDIITSFYGLNDYVKNIEFAEPNDKTSCQYLYFYKTIFMNMYKLNNEKHYKEFGSNYYGLFNLFVVKTIFHEISHANDERVKDNEPTSLEGKLLILDDPFSFLNVPKKDNNHLIKYCINKYKYNKVLKYYDNNYSFAPHERMAITRSCIDMLDIIKADFIINSLYYNMFKDYITNRMENVLYNYRVIEDYTNSPSLEYLWGLFKGNREIILTDKSFYNYSLPAEDRLFYGLSLSKDEYDNIDDVKNNLVKKKSII